MVDLRTLSIAERRVLCGEAQRRARAGEGPVAIRAALGLGRSSYARWAKLYGFRVADIFPSIPHTGAAVLHPPGPGGYARSGRFYAGEGLPRSHPACSHGPGHPGWTGGEAVSRAKYAVRRDGQRDGAQRAVEALSAAELFEMVKAALAAGEISEADRLLRAWRGQKRRAVSLVALEAEADGERAARGELPDGWVPEDGLCGVQISDLSDAQLQAYVMSLVPGMGKL